MADDNLPYLGSSSGRSMNEGLPDFIQWLARLGGSTMVPDVYRALTDFGRSATGNMAADRLGGQINDPALPSPEPTPDMNKLLGGAVDAPMVVGAPLTPLATGKLARNIPAKGMQPKITVSEAVPDDFVPEMLSAKSSKMQEHILHDKKKLYKLHDLYEPIETKTKPVTHNADDFEEAVWDVGVDNNPDKFYSDLEPDPHLFEQKPFIHDKLDDQEVHGWGSTDTPDVPETPLVTQFFFPDTTKYKKLLEREKYERPRMPIHTRYGIPVEEHVPGQTLYHGTKDPEAAESIAKTGFTKGASAEKNITGTSMSEDPLLSVYNFAEGADSMLTARRPDVDIKNMRPSEYVKTPDYWAETADTVPPFHKPQSYFQEDEIFFPGGVEGARRLLKPEHKNDPKHIAWFKDLKEYRSDLKEYASTARYALLSDDVGRVRMGYDRIAKMADNLNASGAYGGAIRDQDIETMATYLGDNIDIDKIIERRRYLGPQRTDALLEAMDAATDYTVLRDAESNLSAKLKHKEDTPELRKQYDDAVRSANKAKQNFMKRLGMLSTVPALPLAQSFFEDEDKLQKLKKGASN